MVSACVKVSTRVLSLLICYVGIISVLDDTDRSYFGTDTGI